MINRILALFDRNTQPASSPPGHSIAEKHIAAAALLFEAAAMDGHVGPEEQRAISDIASSRFGLNQEETATLMEMAERLQEDANQLFGFTREIKNTFKPEERVELMEMLWEVVYADGVLHDHEANLMRRIGGLIYVSEIDRGNARKRAMARLGIE